MARRRVLIELLAAAPPVLPNAAVARAVDEQFDLRGEYAPLISERDQNFRLLACDGKQYVVKIASPADAASIGGFQVDLLDHLQKVSAIAVPRVIVPVAGGRVAVIEQDGMTYPLRVVSYLAGRPLAAIQTGPSVAYEFGQRLAQLDLDMREFDASGPTPESPWDMQRAAELDGLLAYIDDASVRHLVSETIDRFVQSVLPALMRLPRQAIHGDANPENVLVSAESRRVSGFIDFGDSVPAPRIVDVAIAASYLRAPAGDALRLFWPFLEGYDSIAPLTDDERALLPDLLRTRLATTIAIMYWRAAARDGHDAYREKTLQSEAGAIDFLRLMTAGGGIELSP